MLRTALPSAAARPSSRTHFNERRHRARFRIHLAQRPHFRNAGGSPALLIFLLPPGNPFGNGSVRARLQSCRKRRQTTAALAAEAVSLLRSSTNGTLAPDSAFISRQARTSLPPVYPEPRRGCPEARRAARRLFLIFLLPPGNPFGNGSARARLQSCRKRRQTTAALAAEAVFRFLANGTLAPDSAFVSRQACTSVPPASPPALLMFRLCPKPLLAQPLILYRRMSRRIPASHISKVRENRMNTTLRLRRFHIELHPSILARNIPLVMHHHSP